MKIILTQEVSGLGSPGDVVEVKDGYGRNYLMPRGLAVAWTKGGESQVTAIRKARTTREIKSLEDARQIRDRLQASPVRLTARAGASGRLFGAVTPTDIAKAMETAGAPQVDKRKVELPRAIKALGDYTIHVRLHPEVRATVALQVVAES